jgi:hypothetical protein
VTFTPRFLYGAIISSSSISLSSRPYRLDNRTVLRENSPRDELHTLRKYRIESNLKRLKKEAKQQRGRQCIINEWASDRDKQHERLKVSEREMKKRIIQASEAR